MGILESLRFQSVYSKSLIFLYLFSFLFCQSLLASQEAIVTAERALIYSDETMTSPVGYVSRGKKIKIGSISRNKAQVFPIVVSGKIAYVRGSDISTEREAMDPTSRLISDRFNNASKKTRKTRYGLSYYTYTSQITGAGNGYIQDKDILVWNGLSFRAEIFEPKSKWGMQMLLNYMEVQEGKELFRTFEAGAGVTYRFFEWGRLSSRLEGQLLGIPFSSYSLATDVRLNGYGYSYGGGINVSYQFTDKWAMEVYGSAYYSKIMGIDAPRPYRSLSPSFIGNRLGVGANYLY